MTNEYISKDKLEAMSHVFNKDENITAEEFDRLQLEAQSTAARIFKFTVNKFPEKGSIQDEILNVFNQTVVWFEKWEGCVNHPPSHFKDSVIVDYMKNIIMLGHIHNGLMLDLFTKINNGDSKHDE